MIVNEIDEVTALREGAAYELYDEEPESGRYWAVKAVPCSFPGIHYPTTRDGQPVTELVVAIAEKRRDDGLWQWCHPTMACKRLFCDLLLDNAAEPDRWHYILEASR